jgi:hypothetical protein
MGKRIKSEKKGGGGKESKFIEEYTPLKRVLCMMVPPYDMELFNRTHKRKQDDIMF